MNTDLIDASLNLLAIDKGLFLSKLENDQLLKVLLDNRIVFKNKAIYEKLLMWLKKDFDLVFYVRPDLMDKITSNFDAYLIQILYLLAANIHVVFFHKNEDNQSVTPQIALKCAFVLIDAPVSCLKYIDNKTDVKLVW